MPKEDSERKNFVFAKIGGVWPKKGKGGKDYHFGRIEAGALEQLQELDPTTPIFIYLWKVPPGNNRPTFNVSFGWPEETDEPINNKDDEDAPW